MRIRKRLGEMLIDAGLISEDQLQQALAGQKKARLKLGQYLTQQGIVTEEEIIDQISRQLRIEKYDANKYPGNPSLAELVPYDMAQKLQLVPLSKRFNRFNLLTIAMVDPMDINALDTVEAHVNMEVEPVVCSERELSQLISTIYGMQSGMMELM